MESLIAFSSKLTNIHRNVFVFKCGNLLDLLFVLVQKEAVTTLAQFYDPPLRCFTFQDFPLAPKLEEPRRILDSSKEKKGLIGELESPKT